MALILPRRCLLKAGAGALLASMIGADEARAAASGTIFGAIRWDAWFSTAAGEPALQTAATLSTAAFRGRAPIHLATLDPIALAPRISQTIIDAEITAAVSGGLKYWAYLMYGSAATNYNAPDLTTGMMLALAAHRQSAIKNQINWCMMNQLGLMGKTGNFTSQVAQMVAWMGESNYQTVLGGRPLLYVYWSSGDLATWWGGSLSNVAAMISALRTAAQNAGLGNPYIVVINGAELTVYSGIGADAITAYSYAVQPAPGVLNPSYTVLDNAVQAYWATMGALGVPFVPITMTGWNTTPRKQRPPSFANNRPYIGINTSYQDATNAQLAAHLQAAVNYVTSHPTQCPSTAILCYAWNECDEGGGALTPTIGDPTGSRLAAIKSVVQ